MLPAHTWRHEQPLPFAVVVDTARHTRAYTTSHFEYGTCTYWAQSACAFCHNGRHRALILQLPAHTTLSEQLTPFATLMDTAVSRAVSSYENMLPARTGRRDQPVPFATVVDTAR